MTDSGGRSGTESLGRSDALGSGFAGSKLRTSNACETLNSQIKRRTRVVGLFPNEESLQRLV